jgi:hypothetical protein
VKVGFVHGPIGQCWVSMGGRGCKGGFQAVGANEVN